eukprot:2859501-Alexandrium_andersonii.AAC.1
MRAPRSTPRSRRWQEGTGEAGTKEWPQQGCGWPSSFHGDRCSVLRVDWLGLPLLTWGGGGAAHARIPPVACCREALHPVRIMG